MDRPRRAQPTGAAWVDRFLYAIRLVVGGLAVTGLAIVSFAFTGMFYLFQEVPEPTFEDIVFRYVDTAAIFAIGMYVTLACSFVFGKWAGQGGARRPSAGSLLPNAPPTDPAPESRTEQAAKKP